MSLLSVLVRCDWATDCVDNQALHMQVQVPPPLCPCSFVSTNQRSQHTYSISSPAGTEGLEDSSTSQTRTSLRQCHTVWRDLLWVLSPSLSFKNNRNSKLGSLSMAASTRKSGQHEALHWALLLPLFPKMLQTHIIDQKRGTELPRWSHRATQQGEQGLPQATAPLQTTEPHWPTQPHALQTSQITPGPRFHKMKQHSGLITQTICWMQSKGGGRPTTLSVTGLLKPSQSHAL